MKPFERIRATEPHAGEARGAAAILRWMRRASIVLAVGGYLFGYAPSAEPASAQSVKKVQAGTSIARDNSKRAEREAKRAERAAAREARKKERAARAHKHSQDDDDRSYAKAKPSKGSSGKSERSADVDLGDDDPLEGL
jgi:hypothetical protein